MRRHLSPRSVLLLLLALAGPLAASSSAEVAPPQLTVRAKGDGLVRVRWTLRRGTAQPTSRLTVERGTDPTAFAAHLVVDGPKRRQAVEERPGAGTWWYRARVETDAGTSAWSTPVSVVMGTAAGGGTGGGGTLPLGLRECASGAVDLVIELVNDLRTAQGQRVLARNAALTAAARVHTIKQAETGRMTHEGALQEMLDAGYRPLAWGQNVAWGYGTAAAVVDAWLGSGAHRANLLGAGFRDTGVGCVVDGRGVTWWTQNFGG